MDKTMKHQRTIPLLMSNLKVREAEDGNESRTIEGHAVVFGVRSVNLTPWSSYRDVYEVIEPGAITQELINRSDVVLTAYHNNQKILGRCTNGKGTLSLMLDGKGLFVRCDLPRTATGDEMLEAIKRGDVCGMSFAFADDTDDTENGVSYERMEAEKHDGKEVYVRHVKKIVKLYDVTIAGHPAYPQTDIAKREIDEYLDEALKDKPQDNVEEPLAREDNQDGDNGEPNDATKSEYSTKGKPDAKPEEQRETEDAEGSEGDENGGGNPENDNDEKEKELERERENVEMRERRLKLRKARDFFYSLNH